MILKISIKSQVKLVLAGEFIVLACINMTSPYWPLILRRYLPEHSQSNLVLWSTLIYIAPFVASVLRAPLCWGYVGISLGYKKMIIRCTLVLFFVQVMLFVTEWVYGVLALRLVQGAFAGYTPAVQAWLTSKKPDRT